MGVGGLFLGHQGLSWPWAAGGRPYVLISATGRTPRTQSMMSSPKQPDHKLAGSVGPVLDPAPQTPSMSGRQKGVQAKVWWLGCKEQSLTPGIWRCRGRDVPPAPVTSLLLPGRRAWEAEGTELGLTQGNPMRTGWGPGENKKGRKTKHGECEPADTS